MTTTGPSTERPSSAPWHLRGNFAPVPDEVTLTDLAVTGAIPPALDGLYVRNGPNPARGPSGHWFFGDGMVHGIHVSGGAAQWYRNRYVRTARLDEPDAPMFADDGSVDRIHSAANTNIVCHAGRLLALEEGHFPYEVTADLDTIGWTDFDGRLTTALTAHPKLCPETGEMLAFGYGFMDPLLTYHRFAADGTLVQSTDVPVAGPTMHHDFNVTRNHVVFMDLPVVFDLEMAMTGTMPYRWDDDHGARLVVLPRNGTADEARTFEIEPCYVFHPVNAWEVGEVLHIDVARYPELWRVGSTDLDVDATLHRWTIDLVSGRVTETTLDDRPIEFGRVPDRSVGSAHRVAVAPVSGSGTTLESRVVLYDMAADTSSEHDFGPGRHAGETVFAADPDGGDGDGWLITYVHDDAIGHTSLVILDPTDMAADPVATITLPRRIPYGFHGNWVPSDHLA